MYQAQVFLTGAVCTERGVGKGCGRAWCGEDGETVDTSLTLLLPSAAVC